jgi:23S rRNA (cytidine2498-2'-O)-methyltransferase
VDVLFSAAPASLRLAADELASLGAGKPRIVGDDAAIVPVGAGGLGALADRCSRAPALFVRHLTQVRAIAAPDDETALGKFVDALHAPAEVALQVWAAEGASSAERAGVEQALRQRLEALGTAVRRGGAATAVHACLTRHGVVLGSAEAQDTLSDWPGGRVRLRAGDDQISRAALKLEEAALVFGLKLEGPGAAIDLGASPGGWTRVLAARGYRVIAVDPARLDPAVARLRGVEHRKETAQTFFAKLPSAVEVIVNDMRLDAVESAEIMLDAAPHLKPGGFALMTLKLPEARPAEAAARALERLRTGYRLMAARQLFHNRSEVTAVLEPL